MHVFKLGVFFIAGFFHLDIKVIIARAENCKISYQTFLKVGRNWENNNCLFLPFFRLLENEKLKKTQFLAIFRKVWVEDMQFSVLTTIISMSTNWRNPSKKQELWAKMGIFGVILLRLILGKTHTRALVATKASVTKTWQKWRVF